MKYVLVLGYGWTGSSAVFDLLKEYDCSLPFPTEFRLIKDPKGLMDLRYNLIDRWDSLNVDEAIKNYIWFCKKVNRKTRRVPCQIGLNYSHYFNNQFLRETKNYLKDICNFSYSGHWFYLDFYRNPFQLAFNKAISKFNRSLRNKDMYYSDIDGERFDYLTKKYINSLFSAFCSDNKTIVLDQAIPAQLPDIASHFFDDFKIIIVDRDPRDNYCDLIKCKGLMGEQLRKKGDVGFFVSWFKKLRKQIRSSENVLYVRFEDLIYKYDDTVSLIETFAGLDKGSHSKQKCFFNPDLSIKNVGIWKDHYNQDDIRKIESVLSDYIYQGNTIKGDNE